MNKQLHFNFLNREKSKKAKKARISRFFFTQSRISGFILDILEIIISIALIFNTKQIFTKWIFQR
jgi:hypothetical protein